MSFLTVYAFCFKGLHSAHCHKMFLRMGEAKGLAMCCSVQSSGHAFVYDDESFMLEQLCCRAFAPRFLAIFFISAMNAIPTQNCKHIQNVGSQILNP